jgi:hypothetical protein
MLIKLDEQERDYTLCDLSPTYQPAERISAVLGGIWGSWLGPPAAVWLDDEFPRPSVPTC